MKKSEPMHGCVACRHHFPASELNLDLCPTCYSGVFSDDTDNTDSKTLDGASAISSVIAERERQDAKWGEQNHYPSVWLGILGEEFGELCQAVNETWFDNGPEERAKGGFDNMRAEAVQVAAVAVAFVEYLDRRKAGGEEL